MRLINETGNRYGKLVVIERAGRNNCKKVLWKCQCECGKTKIINGNSLRNGLTESCGCYRIKLMTTHGQSRARIYQIWRGMNNRCLNKKSRAYKDYGKRGITICDEWLKFPPFYKWAMSHGYKKTLTIERVDNDLGYYPDNCVWATRTKQQHNRRMPQNNTSGHVGVHWNKKNKNYVAQICNNKEKIHLGSFINIQDATAARKTAENEYWNIPETINLKGE